MYALYLTGKKSIRKGKPSCSVRPSRRALLVCWTSAWPESGQSGPKPRPGSACPARKSGAVPAGDGHGGGSALSDRARRERLLRKHVINCADGRVLPGLAINARCCPPSFRGGVLSMPGDASSQHSTTEPLNLMGRNVTSFLPRGASAHSRTSVTGETTFDLSLPHDLVSKHIVLGHDFCREN